MYQIRWLESHERESRITFVDTLKPNAQLVAGSVQLIWHGKPVYIFSTHKRRQLANSLHRNSYTHPHWSALNSQIRCTEPATSCALGLKVSTKVIRDSLLCDSSHLIWYIKAPHLYIENEKMKHSYSSTDGPFRVLIAHCEHKTCLGITRHFDALDTRRRCTSFPHTQASSTRKFVALKPIHPPKLERTQLANLLHRNRNKLWVRLESIHESYTGFSFVRDKDYVSRTQAI